MTVLIDTHHWLVEFESRCLFVTDRQTGLSATLQGDRIASDVRDCLKTHGPDQVAACYARIAKSLNCEWEGHYKHLPPVGGYLDQDDRRAANSPMARLINRVFLFNI